MHPLVQALHDRTLLCCVGPLFAQVPPDQLARRLAAHCSQDLTGLQPALALGQLAKCLQPEAFIRTVAPVLDRSDRRVPLALMAVARLASHVRFLCTTNLDTALERALHHTWPVFDHDPPPPLLPRDAALLKLCGSAAEPATWRLTADQHAANADAWPGLARLLRSHTVLFLGFDPDDPRLHWLLHLRGRADATTAAFPALALIASDAATRRQQLTTFGVHAVLVHGDYDLGVAEQLHHLAYAYEDAYPSEDCLYAPPPARCYLGDANHTAPYPGMQPYGRNHVATFHGREHELGQISHLLGPWDAPQWLLIHGEPGVGKSSLVTAGLLPRLTCERPTALFGPARTYESTYGTYYFPIAPSRNHVLRTLLTDPMHPRTALDPDVLRQASEAPEHLAELLATRHPDGLAIAVDALDSVDPSEAERISTLLADLLRVSRVPLLVITVVRSSSLARLTPPVMARCFALGPLTVNGARRAVLGPAEAVGLTVPERFLDRFIADFHQVRETSPPWRAMGLFAAILESLSRLDRSGLPLEDYQEFRGFHGVLDHIVDTGLVLLHSQYTASAIHTVLTGLVGDSPNAGKLRPADAQQLAQLAPSDRVQREVLSLVDRYARNDHFAYRITLFHFNTTRKTLTLAHPVLLETRALRDWLEKAARGVPPPTLPVIPQVPAAVTEPSPWWPAWVALAGLPLGLTLGLSPLQRPLLPSSAPLADTVWTATDSEP